MTIDNIWNKLIMHFVAVYSQLPGKDNFWGVLTIKGRYMLGSFFILLGLGLLLNKMDIISIGEWWPLLIILLGLYQLIKGKGASKGGLLLVLIGGFILCIIHGRKIDILACCIDYCLFTG